MFMQTLDTNKPFGKHTVLTPQKTLFYIQCREIIQRMLDKETPLDREEFKNLTKNERQFIENPETFLKKYTSPDAMARQYNSRIRYRSINAIQDLLLIIEKLHEKQLQKIFTDQYIEDLFTITSKALEIADWRYSATLNEETGYVRKTWRNKTILPSELVLNTETGEVIRTSNHRDVKKLQFFENREKILKNYMRDLLKYLFPETELKIHDELIIEYGTPRNLNAKLSMLNFEVGNCHFEKGLMEDFIKNQGLYEKYETEKLNIKQNTMRTALKEEGWSDKKIENFIKKFSEK